MTDRLVVPITLDALEPNQLSDECIQARIRRFVKLNASGEAQDLAALAEPCSTLQTLAVPCSTSQHLALRQLTLNARLGLVGFG